MIDIGRLRRAERHVLAWLGQRWIILVGDFAQSLLDACELALRFDHRGGIRIVRSLGFLHIGDRDQAHVIALIGLFELPADRVESGLVRINGVLGRKHIEVGGRDALDETLLRGLVVGFRLRHLLVRTAQSFPVRPGEHALLQLQVVLALIRVAADGKRQWLQHCGIVRVGKGFHRVGLGARARDCRIAGDLRQQCRKGLRRALPGRHAGGVGLVDQRIELHGVVVDLHQVTALRHCD